MLRRGLALGGGLIVLILLVLGVKGCLDARANRALSDYAEDVSQIVAETDQTSKDFFGKLADPGALSVTEFTAEVNADRSAMDNYAARIDGLDAPGDMSRAQNALELTYELRSSAMTEIADKMPTALGDAGADKAVAGIARQMQKLLAADALYAPWCARKSTASSPTTGSKEATCPRASSCPTGPSGWKKTRSAPPSARSAAPAAPRRRGSTGWNRRGQRQRHRTRRRSGHGLRPKKPSKSKSKSKTRANRPRTASASRPRVGGTELEGSIESIGAGEISTVSIPLTPTPKGEVTLEVKVDTVPGEQVSENNEASYTVVFE